MIQESSGESGGRFPEQLRIEPLRRRVAVDDVIPGSKSIANRALLLAGVADGESHLRGIPDSEDVGAAVAALRTLGIGVEGGGPSAPFRVRGGGGRFPAEAGRLDIGSSGTVGRFLPGLLAAAGRGVWEIAASPQLAGRPLSPLLTALRGWGADIGQPDAPRSFPLTVRGGALAGGAVRISAAGSSQFASGLLMAAPLARRPADILIHDGDPHEAYIDMTLDLMRVFGIAFSEEGAGRERRIRLEAPQRYAAANLAIEADYNTAGYFLALPLLLGGTATIRNLSRASRQPGRKFLAVIERLGGRVAETGDGVTVGWDGGRLRGGFDVDMRPMSEMALTLGVLAAFADAPVRMKNLSRIRAHETDRLAALAAALRDCGVGVDAGDDWIRVRPSTRERLAPAVIDSRGDHRLAMSFSLLALAGNGLTLRNPGAVAKTSPDFFRRLENCGARIHTP